jgi:hypothetical protein
VLAARFEPYLARQAAGDPAPRSAREAAERIGWQAHTVAKRCENIRNRYVRLGVPGQGNPWAAKDLGRSPRLPGASPCREPAHPPVINPCPSTQDQDEKPAGSSRCQGAAQVPVHCGLAFTA